MLHEKHLHLVLLHHSWRHLVVLNWLLAPDMSTKTLQYAWVLTENNKHQFHVKVYHFGFSSSRWSMSAAASVQVAEPMHWYFTAVELQFVSFINDSHQCRLNHLLLLSYPLLLHHHHFITASVLSQPCLYTYHPNPLHHHRHVYTSLHCTAHNSLTFIFHFWILHCKLYNDKLKVYYKNIKSSVNKPERFLRIKKPGPISNYRTGRTTLGTNPNQPKNIQLTSKSSIKILEDYKTKLENF